MNEENGFWANFWLFFKVRWFNFKDIIKTIVLYWIRSPSFALIDLSVLFSYFFQSPYRIVKDFTDDSEPYGETPLVVMDKIAKKAAITEQDYVLELGCGRGRVCFWLAKFIGCRTLGIDTVPIFIQKAEKIRQKFSLSNVEFRVEDMLAVDLAGFSVLYLFGTCLNDEDITAFIEKLKKVKKGTKIITISYALTEYKNVHYLQLTDTFEVHFPWGITDCYVHVRM